jgi:hypothetical protein
MEVGRRGAVCDVIRLSSDTRYGQIASKFEVGVGTAESGSCLGNAPYIG